MAENSKPIFRLSFFFDYLSQSCLWCDNDASCEKFDVGPIDATFFDKNGNITREPKIKLPTILREKVNYLSNLFDSSLNWDDPREPEPTWTNEKQNEFNIKSKELHSEISNFLGDDYEIIYKH